MTKRYELQNKKILIYDQLLDSAERLESLFHQSSPHNYYKVKWAQTTQDVLSFYHNLHPDIVLVNASHNLSVAEQLCEHIRAKDGRRHTGIIVINEKQEKCNETSIKMLEMGADDYLAKGFEESELIARVNAVIRIKSASDELRRANHKLRVLSLTDELTGLYNMRAFEPSFKSFLNKARMQGKFIGAIMFDLDRFKQVNDNHDHLAGSFVIKTIGQIIQNCSQIKLQQTDFAARYGGDEFVVLSIIASEQEILQKALEIKEAIQSYNFEYMGNNIKLTASIGCSLSIASEISCPTILLKDADMMLYRSKRSGRNKVSIKSLVNFG